MPGDLQFSQPMQDFFCSPSQFLQRTDALASALDCYLRDLPAKIGISERSMFGYRAGKYPVTAKALRKLEAAERAAGVASAAPPPPPGEDSDFVVREGSPKYSPPFSPTESNIRALVRDELARVAVPVIALDDLRRHMLPAGAWPPAGPDLLLTPAEILVKYPLPPSD
jgi:hypothetical protein